MLAMLLMSHLILILIQRRLCRLTGNVLVEHTQPVMPLPVMTLPGIIDNRPGVLELVWVKHVHPVEQRQCSEICCSVCEFPLRNCEAFAGHQIEQVVARLVVHACVKHSDTQYKGTSLCKQPFLGAIEICKHASENGCLRKWHLNFTAG